MYAKYVWKTLYPDKVKIFFNGIFSEVFNAKY